MTIKQQGGIFGRNPSFNDVNAVDLEVTNRLGINETSPDARLQVSGSRMNSASEGVVVEGTWPWVMLKDTESGQASFVQYVDGGNYIVKTIPHADKDSAPNGVGTEVFRWNSSGNLALPNGKGIDFSATAGTGTSELFDDYEEGAWTVELYDAASGGNVSPTTATGYYTKIGRQVNLTFSLSNIDTTGMTAGNVLYFTLPFTAGFVSTGSLVLDSFAMTAGRTWAAPWVNAADTRGRFRQSGNAVTAANLTVATVVSGTSDIERCTLTYFVG